MKKNFYVFIIITLCSASVTIATDFNVIMHVTDGVNNTELTFGKNQNGSDGYDNGLDQYAPPEPPDGSFDARFKWNNESWIKDIRDDSDEEKIFEMQYKPASGAGPIIISWDSTGLSQLGTFKIVDTITGSLVDTVDMTETDHLDTSIDEIYDNGINIIVNSPVISGLRAFQNKIIPETHIMAENYPNPFNSSTIIEYSLPKKQEVNIELLTIKGQIIKILYTGVKDHGIHNFIFNASGLASGVYLYRINAGNYSAVKKMMYIR